MQQKKLNYIVFFPSDWLSDIQLHQCSAEARGVWMDMLCIMAKSSRYGYLINGDGNPFSLEQLAYVIRMSKARLQVCLNELEREGIFLRGPDGVIYSKRLVRDAEKILARRESGRERVQRFRERQSSEKHSCESSPNRRKQWDYFIERGYGQSQSDWEAAGRPGEVDIRNMEKGYEPWPSNAYWSGGKRK